MHTADNLIALFGSEFTRKSAVEDFDRLELVYTLRAIAVPEQTELKRRLGAFNDADTSTLYIDIDDATDKIVYNFNLDYSPFKDALEIAIAGIEADSSIQIKLIVQKQVIDHRISIYSWAYIKEFLDQFSVAGAVTFFADLIKQYDKIILISEDQSASCHSAAIAFQPKDLSGKPVTFLSTASRDRRLLDIQSATHAVALSDKSIIPEDFQFDTEPEALVRPILTKIEFVLLLFAIFDQTQLEDDVLTFRLNGYKSVDGKVDLKAIPLENYVATYREIYNWIYVSGNLTDKLGLARNIISLHLNPTNDLSFSGEMFSSILSAYKVYEKQNIKQYIEIRNKMSDQLLDYNKRANTIVETFAGTFQKGALSVLTLFASIIALKVLSTMPTDSNFKNFSTIFALVIWLVSIVYMFISRSDALEQKTRYEDSYTLFKERYGDLLNADDISRILNDDKEFDADKAYIIKKLRNYTILWAVVLGTLLLFVAAYYYYGK